jgi:hypothetical protein
MPPGCEKALDNSVDVSLSSFYPTTSGNENGRKDVEVVGGSADMARSELKEDPG